MNRRVGGTIDDCGRIRLRPRPGLRASIVAASVVALLFVLVACVASTMLITRHPRGIPRHEFVGVMNSGDVRKLELSFDRHLPFPGWLYFAIPNRIRPNVSHESSILLWRKSTCGLSQDHPLILDITHDAAAVDEVVALARLRRRLMDIPHQLGD
jgi:hypothetical protein